MGIYRPTELRQFLDSLGIAPKKGLSQNFLIDGNILRKIGTHVEPGDIVVEIGPGPGSLTEVLLERGAKVIAIEKDPVLAGALERLKGETGTLEVFCADFMQFPLEETLKARLPAGTKGKVIANLPYHLTTPILAKLVKEEPLISDLVLMVQDEVARRFTAQPGTSEYSSFTIFLNYYAKVKYAFQVRRNSFYPPPKVDSAVVHLKLHPSPFVEDEELLFKITRTAFEHRRKMLRSSLRELFAPEAIMEGLQQIGKDPQSRPETLSLSEFIALSHFLKGYSQKTV